MSQTILITGASSGIGKATVKHFSENGWNVIATMRNPEKEKELLLLENVLITHLDVQDKKSISESINAGIDAFGQIDAIINNAGYGQYGVFEAISDEQIMQQFAVNVFGVMDVTRAILPHFRERKAGTIVNISSGAGRFTLPLMTMYCASKFALEGFSEALSFELASQNIKMKIVEPGGTTTNFIKVSEENFAGGSSLNDYAHYIGKFNSIMEAMKSVTLKTPEEVAAVIYDAVTDGTDTLRYAIGNEGFTRRLDARRTMTDQEYIEDMRRLWS